MAGKRDSEMVVSRRCCGKGEGHVGKVVWKLYLMSKYLAFKVLLVIDNTPGHLQDLGLVHPTIQAEHLSNTTN